MNKKSQCSSDVLNNCLFYFLDCQHFEVILEKVEDGCPGPSISLAGCSPVVFPLASPLVKDFIRFDLDRSGKILYIQMIESI